MDDQPSTPYIPTVGELCEFRQIFRARPRLAASAYLAGDVSALLLSSRYAINVAEAVRANPFAAAMVSDAALDSATRRAVAVAAILIAYPHRC